MGSLFSKLIIASLALFGSALAQAHELSLRCAAESLQACEARVQSALFKMTCDPQEIACDAHTEVDGDGHPTGKAIYCNAQSAKCAEAQPYLFGGVYCSDNMRRENLVKYDRNLTLSYSTGLLQKWVRSICVGN